MKTQKAFTLIELLVVISIISLLSTIIMSNISTARAKARDVERKQDLRSIATALELYYTDNNAYPLGGAGSDRSCWKTKTVNDDISGCHPLGVLISGGYMESIPYDPGRNNYVGALGSASCPYCGCGSAQFYAYWSNGQKYLLGAVEETKGNTGCTVGGNWDGLGYQGGGPTNSPIDGRNRISYQYYIYSPK